MKVPGYDYSLVTVSLVEGSGVSLVAEFSPQLGSVLLSDTPFPKEWHLREVRVEYTGLQVVVTGEFVYQDLNGVQWPYVRVSTIHFGDYRAEVVLGPYTAEAAHVYLWRLYSPEGELLTHLGFRLPYQKQVGLDMYLEVLRSAVRPIVQGTGGLRDLWDAINSGKE